MSDNWGDGFFKAIEEKPDSVTLLREAYREQQKLLTELEKSLIIEEIWPEAFDHGSVRFTGVKKWDGRMGKPNQTLYKAWLVNGAGKRRYLTREEVAMLHPELTLHKDFEVPKR